MRFSLLLFDLDGTLVDSRKDLALSINEMLVHFNYPPLNEQSIIDAVGDGVTMLISRCLEKAGAGVVGIKMAKPVFVEFYKRRLTENTIPYPGVVETLVSLDHVKKAVITNKMEDLSRRLLDDLDLAKYFDLVVGGDTLPERKPSGMPVAHACETLGISTEQTLMVGDSVNDILSARNAKTASAAGLYGLQSEDRLKKEQADYYLLSFSELLTIV